MEIITNVYYSFKIIKITYVIHQLSVFFIGLNKYEVSFESHGIEKLMGVLVWKTFLLIQLLTHLTPCFKFLFILHNNFFACNDSHSEYAWNIILTQNIMEIGEIVIIVFFCLYEFTEAPCAYGTMWESIHLHSGMMNWWIFSYKI